MRISLSGRVRTPVAKVVLLAVAIVAACTTPVVVGSSIASSAESSFGFETVTDEIRYGGDLHRSTAIAHSGSWALGTNRVGDVFVRQGDVDFTSTGGQFAFWYHGGDGFVIHLNGAEIVRVSGQPGWQQYSTSLAAGTYVLHLYMQGDCCALRARPEGFIDDLTGIAPAPKPHEGFETENVEPALTGKLRRTDSASRTGAMSLGTPDAAEFARNEGSFFFSSAGGPFSFWWRSEIDGTYGGASISLDGVEIASHVDGQTWWRQYSGTLSAGDHVLSMSVRSYFDVGHNAAWIDDLVGSITAAIPVVSTYEDALASFETMSGDVRVVESGDHGNRAYAGLRMAGISMGADAAGQSREGRFTFATNGGWADMFVLRHQGTSVDVPCDITLDDSTPIPTPYGQDNWAHWVRYLTPGVHHLNMRCSVWYAELGYGDGVAALIDNLTITNSSLPPDGSGGGTSQPLIRTPQGSVGKVIARVDSLNPNVIYTYDFGLYLPQRSTVCDECRGDPLTEMKVLGPVSAFSTSLVFFVRVRETNELYLSTDRAHARVLERSNEQKWWTIEWQGVGTGIPSLTTSIWVDPPPESCPNKKLRTVARWPGPLDPSLGGYRLISWSYDDNGRPSHISPDAVLSAIRAAMKEWERTVLNEASISFAYVPPGTDVFPNSPRNAAMELEWHDLASPAGVPAVTPSWSDPLVETATVKLNRNSTWTVGSRTDGEFPLDIQTILLHELGHALMGTANEGHSKEADHIMYCAPLRNGSHRTLTPDDVNEARALYGLKKRSK